MTQLNKYERTILESETVNVDGTTMTGMQILKRIESPMIEEGNKYYFINVASTNAVLERMFKALGF
jgi:hypothetical protein